MINYIPKLIKSIQTVHMAIKSFALMMTNTANQFIFIEDTNLWKKCLHRENNAKK